MCKRIYLEKQSLCQNDSDCTNTLWEQKSQLARQITFYKRFKDIRVVEDIKRIGSSQTIKVGQMIQIIRRYQRDKKNRIQQKINENDSPKITNHI